MGSKVVLESLMGKNVKGGNKSKKQKNSDNNDVGELQFKGEEQDYATVLTLLGNGRCRVQCHSDGVTRLAIIRGCLKKKKIFIANDDVVLISLRDYEDAKCDLLDKYTSDQVRSLIAYGEIENKPDKKESEEEEYVCFGEIDDI